MAENRTNRVFVSLAGRKESDSDTGKIRVDGLVMKKVTAGMNSGDFEQTIKAYAMFDDTRKLRADGLVMKKITTGMNSGDFEQTIKAYAMFDRISKGRISKGRQKTA